MIKLKSSDGEIFEVEENYLNKSKVLCELKEFLKPDEDLLVKEVEGKTLSEVIEYLKHYVNEEPKEIPKPLPSPDLKQVLSEWDYNYISYFSLEEIVDLVNAASYLDINGLVNLASAKLASEMINCPVEEAREKFGIKVDMTEEDIKEMDYYPLD